MKSASTACSTIGAWRLETSRAAAQELVAAHGADATVEATLDRREALARADYVVTSFQVGGLESTLVDFEIPTRYGLRQTIGDTLGVGGISRALRTIPVLLDVCRDRHDLAVEEVDLDGYAASGLPTRTMGRDIGDDALFFAAPLASGRALAKAVNG